MNRPLLLLFAVLTGGGVWYGAGEERTSHWIAFLKEARASKLNSDAPPSLRAPRTLENAAPVPVVTAPANAEAVPVTRTSIGWIEPVARVAVRARIDGMIVARSLHDGATVSAGDVLFQLDDREIRAQIARGEAALARDQAVLSREQAALKRTQDLLSKSVATQAQAEEAAANVRIAAANVAASEAALAVDRARLGYTTITAPISGRAGVVRASVGHLVRGSDVAGDGLVTITQMSPLQVSFSLPERDLPLLRAALSDPARKSLVRVLADHDGSLSSEAVLSFMDASVEASSGTILVKATLSGDVGLWPGQYVRVEAHLGRHPEAVTVPHVALRLENEGAHVFVVQPSGLAQKRRVEPLETRGDRTVIAQGLTAGERVIVDGHPRLRHGSPVVETIQAAATLPGGPPDLRDSGPVGR